jgi:hypothetical protein
MTTPLPQKPLALGSKCHGVDDHRVLAVQPQHSDLQQRTITGWPDQHAEIVIELDPPHAMAHRMQDVLIGDAMLSCRPPIRT